MLSFFPLKEISFQEQGSGNGGITLREEVIMKQILLKIGLGGVVLLIITTLFQTGLWGAEFERRDVTFKSHGLKCAGWYYVPKV